MLSVEAVSASPTSRSTTAAAVTFDKVSKRYRLGVGHFTVRETLASLPERLFHRQMPARHGSHEFWALKDVSFMVERGEALGIIGPNGAGKTTVLKVLSRITRPTLGSVSVSGRLSALIELGAGFHPDLTGRENVFLNGSILGLTRREIQHRFDSIVAFSELERFIDTPVKRYSTGMYARLGFAVAAHVEPDVLLVDEVLSVGDMAFQSKCFRRMNELLRGGTTLLFVSHNLKAVQQVCERAIVLYDGAVAYEGQASAAVAEYANTLRRNASRDLKPSLPETEALAQRRMTHGARIEHVDLLSPAGARTSVMSSGETVRILVTIRFFEDAEKPIFACAIRGESGETVYDVTTDWMGQETPDFKSGDLVIVEWQLQLNLLDGTYQLSVDAAYSDLTCYYDYLAHAISFVVVGGNNARGVANLWAGVSFRREPPR